MSENKTSTKVKKKNFTWEKKTHNDSTPTDRNYQQQMNCGIWSIRGCTNIRIKTKKRI